MTHLFYPKFWHWQRYVLLRNTLFSTIGNVLDCLVLLSFWVRITGNCSRLIEVQMLAPPLRFRRLHLPCWHPTAYILTCCAAALSFSLYFTWMLCRSLKSLSIHQSHVNRKPNTQLSAAGLAHRVSGCQLHHQHTQSAAVSCKTNTPRP